MSKLVVRIREEEADQLGGSRHLAERHAALLRLLELLAAEAREHARGRAHVVAREQPGAIARLRERRIPAVGGRARRESLQALDGARRLARQRAHEVLRLRLALGLGLD